MKRIISTALALALAAAAFTEGWLIKGWLVSRKTPAHHHVVMAFNTDFYVAAATVIPVLYLALAVQGQTYKNMLETSRHITERTVRAFELASQTPPRSARRKAFLGEAEQGCYTGCLTLLGAVFILLFGSTGEVTAIQALANHSDDELTRAYVLGATIYLALAAAGYPFLLLLRYLIATAKLQVQVTEMYDKVRPELRALRHLRHDETPEQDLPREQAAPPDEPDE